MKRENFMKEIIKLIITANSHYKESKNILKEVRSKERLSSRGKNNGKCE